jgi:hypothetical protein
LLNFPFRRYYESWLKPPAPPIGGIPRDDSPLV